MAFNMQSIILLVIGLVIVGAMVPTGLDALNNANTTGWTTGEIALFGVIGIAALAGIVMGVLKGRSGRS